MKFNKSLAIFFSLALSCVLGSKGAEAYNLAPQSFENFYAVAAEGDLQGLKNMQRRGLNMDATNQNGDTAVCVAVKSKTTLPTKLLFAPVPNHIQPVLKKSPNTLTSPF